MKFYDDEKLYRRILNNKRKKFNKYESILKAWYGEENGAGELTNYLPEEEELKDVLDKIISKNLGPKEYKLIELKKNWSKLMGSQIAKISQPISIKNNYLAIEVENSAWLMELRTFHGRLLEKKIREFCGNNFFYKINYILKGHNKK